MANNHEYLAHKIKGEPVEPYKNSQRAAKVYSHYLSGFAEDEIAYFFKISETEVKLDLQYVQSGMSPRAIIAHNNDRARILVQREQSDKYRRLLKDSLAKPVDEWLASGISPVGVMKEYRESVGMVQRPEGMSINFNRQTNNTANVFSGNGTPIRGVEDIIRGILQANPEKQISAPIDLTPEQLGAIDAASDEDASTDEESD